MKIAARLVFREAGQSVVHIKQYADVQPMKVDLDLIYSGNGWLQLREGELPDHSFEEYVRSSDIVWYRSEVFSPPRDY